MNDFTPGIQSDKLAQAIMAEVFGWMLLNHELAVPRSSKNSNSISMPGPVLSDRALLMGLTPRQLIWWAMSEANWDQRRAAALLGVSGTRMQRLLCWAEVPKILPSRLARLLAKLQSPNFAKTWTTQMRQEFEKRYAAALLATSEEISRSSPLLELTTLWAEARASGSPRSQQPGQRGAGTTPPPPKQANSSTKRSPAGMSPLPEPLQLRLSEQKRLSALAERAVKDLLRKTLR